MKLRTSTLFLSLIFLHCATGAQTSVPTTDESDEAPQQVVVAGVKDPAIKPYRQMLRGLEAFEKFRMLAPQAPLRFKLLPASSSISLTGAQITIAGATVNIPVSVEPDGSFVLPHNDTAAEENAELTLNKKKADIRWRTDIRSPGIDAKQPRLGDLRLACEVNWAILKDDLSFVKRNAISIIGGPCRSSKIHVYTPAPRAIRAATLKEGDRQLVLRLSRDEVSYNAPLSDESWGNDARIELDYRETQ